MTTFKSDALRENCSKPQISFRNKLGSYSKICSVICSFDRPSNAPFFCSPIRSLPCAFFCSFVLPFFPSTCLDVCRQAFFFESSSSSSSSSFFLKFDFRCSFVEGGFDEYFSAALEEVTSSFSICLCPKTCALIKFLIAPIFHFLFLNFFGSLTCCWRAFGFLKGRRASSSSSSALRALASRDPREKNRVIIPFSPEFVPPFPERLPEGPNCLR